MKWRMFREIARVESEKDQNTVDVEEGGVKRAAAVSQQHSKSAPEYSSSSITRATYFIGASLTS